MEESTKLTDDFAYEVLSVVEEIPEGKVSTYGQIARQIGREKNVKRKTGDISFCEIFPVFSDAKKIPCGLYRHPYNAIECPLS